MLEDLLSKQSADLNQILEFLVVNSLFVATDTNYSNVEASFEASNEFEGRLYGYYSKAFAI